MSDPSPSHPRFREDGSLPLPQGERGFFGEAASRLCGVAAVMLGWRPAEFWDSTPAELALVLRPLTPVAEGPDCAALDELRRRFPDE